MKQRLISWFHQDARVATCNDWKHLKLIIFDFDGTIADTFDVGFTIFNELAEELGCRQVEHTEISRMRTMHTLELLRYMRIPITRMGYIARRGCEELSARIDSIQPFVGASQALHALHAHGYRLGIITSNLGSNVSRFLCNHDLEIFEFVQGSSKILGKAREIRAVLRKLKLHPAEVLLVGDETRDVETAKTAGIPVASISWGYAARPSLEAMCPNVLIDDLEQLVSVLTCGGEPLLPH